jgi:hypothetical protein
MSLEAAWGKLAKTLKKQKQGTCGVYSFWYATLLLGHLGGKKGIVYPRRCERPKGVTGESSRHFAKKNVNSGQGEILSEREMVTIVEHYGYSTTCYTPSGTDTRKAFITGHLNANQPILIAYLMGDYGPETVNTSTTYGGGPGAGAHWSLLIGESGSEYRYLEPNDPNQITVFNKDRLLAANACVDNVKFVQYWKKPGKHGLDGVGDFDSWIEAKWKAGLFTTVYDLGAKSRQTLNEVLIAVS